MQLALMRAFGVSSNPSSASDAGRSEFSAAAAASSSAASLASLSTSASASNDYSRSSSSTLPDLGLAAVGTSGQTGSIAGAGGAVVTAELAPVALSDVVTLVSGGSSGSESEGGGAELGSLTGGEEPTNSLGTGVEAFILSNLLRPEVRKARVAALAAHAQSFSYSRHEKLMTIGSMFSQKRRRS
jgi:hypothetical protein